MLHSSQCIASSIPSFICCLLEEAIGPKYFESKFLGDLWNVLPNNVKFRNVRQCCEAIQRPPSKGWPYSFPHLNIHAEPWFLLRVKPGSPHMTASWDRCGRLGNCWTSSCLVIFGARIPLSWNLQRRGDNWHGFTHFIYQEWSENGMF